MFTVIAIFYLTALTGLSFLWRRSLFPVRKKLNFCIVCRLLLVLKSLSQCFTQTYPQKIVNFSARNNRINTHKFWKFEISQKIANIHRKTGKVIRFFYSLSWLTYGQQFFKIKFVLITLEAIKLRSPPLTFSGL